MISPAGRVMRPHNPRAWACRFGGVAFVVAVRGCLAPPSDARPLHTFPRWAFAHIQRITHRHSRASAGRSTLVAFVIAAAVASALPVDALGSVAAGSRRSGPPTLTAQRLQADLLAGARTRRIPADLSPRARGRLEGNACHRAGRVQRPARWRQEQRLCVRRHEVAHNGRPVRGFACRGLVSRT